MYIIVTRGPTARSGLSPPGGPMRGAVVELIKNLRRSFSHIKAKRYSTIKTKSIGRSAGPATDVLC